eukprot:55979-Chlamydomonas_euryale.AAC.1
MLNCLSTLLGTPWFLISSRARSPALALTSFFLSPPSLTRPRSPPPLLSPFPWVCRACRSSPAS